MVLFLPVAEFRQTDDWTLRCRGIIHKNIQEDPWNLPNSIKTLVESLQRFVDGMYRDKGKHVKVYRVMASQLSLFFKSLQMGRTSSSWLCSSAQVFTLSYND